MQTDIKFPRLNVQFVILTEFDMLITNCIQASVSLNESQINHISTSIQTSKEMRRSFIEKDTTSQKCYSTLLNDSFDFDHKKI